jgi:hypothetical protein
MWRSLLPHRRSLYGDTVPDAPLTIVGWYPVCASTLQGDFKPMKKLLRGFAVSGLSLIALSFITACSTKETSRTTTYVPTAEAPAPVIVTPPARVVINPAPVVVAPPEENTTTNSTTVEKKTDSSSSDHSPNEANERSESSYHSETSTVSPQ